MFCSTMVEFIHDLTEPSCDASGSSLRLGPRGWWWGWWAWGCVRAESCSPNMVENEEGAKLRILLVGVRYGVKVKTGKS